LIMRKRQALIRLERARMGDTSLKPSGDERAGGSCIWNDSCSSRTAGSNVPIKAKMLGAGQKVHSRQRVRHG
jgi:hypothetical protein